MNLILIISVITLAQCLEVERKQDDIDEEIKKVITKYINNIPDIEPQYVIHKGFSKMISRYFKQKISAFPLYKISLKLDRNPVKIPWSLFDTANVTQYNTKENDTNVNNVKTYQYVTKKEQA